MEPSLLHTRDPLFTVDCSQRVTFWNESCERLIGPASEAVGRRCFEVAAFCGVRNAAHCRLDCAAIVGARQGRIPAGFRLWVHPPQSPADDAGAVIAAAPTPVEVSVLVVAGQDEEGPSVLHLLHGVRARQGAGPIGVAPPQFADQALPPALTPRQREVLARIARGESPAEIARALDLTPVTVRNHLQGAMDRLGVHSRLDAVLIAMRRGLLSS